MSAHDEGAQEAGAPERLKGIASSLAILALVVGVLIGADAFGLRRQLFGSVVPEPRRAASSRVAGDGSGDASSTVLRSNPWWQEVAVLEGEGPGATESFTIDDGALQWRVSPTCETGSILIEASGEDEPVADLECPTIDVGYGVHPGPHTLQVAAEGRWHVVVEQQIDVPLEEPPLPEMTDRNLIATSDLYGIERTGEGKVELYELPNGRFALRLEDYYVTPNVDLEIRLSPLREPHSTKRYADAPSEFAGRLDITTGSLNFMIPRGTDPTEYRSIVIWCPPLAIAYAGASLGSL